MAPGYGTSEALFLFNISYPHLALVVAQVWDGIALEVFDAIGNAYSNSIWEANLPQIPAAAGAQASPKGAGTGAANDTWVWCGDDGDEASEAAVLEAVAAEGPKAQQGGVYVHARVRVQVESGSASVCRRGAWHQLGSLVTGGLLLVHVLLGMLGEWLAGWSAVLEGCGRVHVRVCPLSSSVSLCARWESLGVDTHHVRIGSGRQMMCFCASCPL